MKRMSVYVGLAVIALLVGGCQPQMSPIGTGALQEEAVAEAGVKTGETVALLIEARATGDFAALESFLAAEDPEGDLRQVLEQAGVFAPTPVVKCTGIDLPGFWDEEVYKYGDVLVSKGAGTTTSSLMELVLVRGYTHAGILNTDLAFGEDWDAPCVLSADVDYLSSTDPAKFALTYETYRGWQANNEAVAVLRRTEGEPNLEADPIAGFFADLEQGKNTVYAFLGYPGTPYEAFEPIPKDDPTYWYCSKVPWRVFNGLGEGSLDIEAADFYFDGNRRYKVIKESLLYKLYRIWIMKKNGWYWWQWWRWPLLEHQATEGLKNVLRVLVTPDELRAWPGWQSVQTFPDSDFDAACWAGYGGWEP